MTALSDPGKCAAEVVPPQRRMEGILAQEIGKVNCGSRKREPVGENRRECWGRWGNGEVW